MQAGCSRAFVLLRDVAVSSSGAAVSVCCLPSGPRFIRSGAELDVAFRTPDSMGVVRRVVSDVVTPNRGAFLSFGLLGTLWSSSGGFAAAIEALNIAYDVEETRSFWKTRPLAVGLTFLIGLLLLIALGIMIVGPRFGEWLSYRAHLSQLWVWVWPYIHWTLAVGFTVLAVEALYFLAPNVKQRFWTTLPGAILAVGCWIGLSYLLGICFRSFANFSRTLRNPRSRIRLNGMALLDGVCHADRR